MPRKQKAHEEESIKDNATPTSSTNSTKQSIEPIDEIYNKDKITVETNRTDAVPEQKDIFTESELESVEVINSSGGDLTVVTPISSNVVVEKSGEISNEEPSSEVAAPKFSISKLGEPKDSSKINKFDMVFVKLWSYIVSAVIGVASGINYCINGVFKRKLPDKYLRAFVATALIISIVLLFTLPFRINISQDVAIDIYGDGLLAVKVETHKDEENYPVYKWGYANKNGKMIIAPVFEEATPFMHGVAWVRHYNKKIENEETKIEDYWYLIDKKGKHVGKTQLKFYTDTQTEYDRPVGNFTKDVKLSWVIMSGRYGYINTSGNIKIDNKYKYAEDFSESLARVREGAQEFYIDKNGKAISAMYDEIKTFTGGLGAVKRNEVWGFVNNKGKMIIEPSYDDVTVFKGEYAAVRRGNTYGIIDKKGKAIVPLLFYNDIKTVSSEFTELIESIHRE